MQTSQALPPKHPDETPIPDYEVPGYNPAQPQFAPPPRADDEDIYNASPTDQHPPKWGHSHHQQQESDGEAGKKKSNRLSAFGAAFSSKVAGPVNALAHKFGAEGFLPESLDKECEKAARILRGFCSMFTLVRSLNANTMLTSAFRGRHLQRHCPAHCR
jgi:hypothetical protein